jgi:hypothetical protein
VISQALSWKNRFELMKAHHDDDCLVVNNLIHNQQVRFGSGLEKVTKKNKKV